MLSFEKPENLNGAELIAEFASQGIEIEIPIVDDNNVLWLSVASKDKSKAEEIVSNHNGTIVSNG